MLYQGKLQYLFIATTLRGIALGWPENFYIHAKDDATRQSLAYCEFSTYFGPIWLKLTIQMQNPSDLLALHRSY